MFPASSIFDVKNKVSRDMKILCNLSRCLAVPKHFLYSSCLLFSMLCVPYALAAQHLIWMIALPLADTWHQLITQRMSTVVLICQVFQIYGAIVYLVPIFVIYCPSFWSFTQKCKGHNRVNVSRRSNVILAETNILVSAAAYVRRDDFRNRCIQVRSIAPDSPQIRDGVVALIICYGIPFFFCNLFGGKLNTSHDLNLQHRLRLWLEPLRCFRTSSARFVF